jgi:hypothetical protein
MFGTKARYSSLWGLLLLSLLSDFLAGCGGGQKSHDIYTSASGTVLGVATQPGNSETRIDVDTWIHVYWPKPPFPPPSSFNFRLEKADDDGDWDGVNTSLEEQDSDPRNGSWWFSPTTDLDRNSWYRIVITDNYGNVEYAVFRTGKTKGSVLALSENSTQMTSEGRYRPAGKESAKPRSGGTVTHVVTR